MRLLEVKRVVSPTPRVRRITLGGAEIEGFVTLSPEDHVKIFFPARGERMPVLPAIGPAGMATREGPKPVMRDYTPKRFDPLAGELDIDFFLNDGGGVASAWAAQAAPGQALGVAGPRGSHVVPLVFDWYLLVGDETALPAILRRLEEFPEGTPVVVVAIVATEAEIQPVPVWAGESVTWITLPPEKRAGGAVLVETLRRMAFPRGEGFAWVAGEVEEARLVYRHLLQERAFARERIHVSGHWKRGVSNHDHHQPIEP